MLIDFDVPMEAKAPRKRGGAHDEQYRAQTPPSKRPKRSSGVIGPKNNMSRKERKELEKTRKARRNKNFTLIEEVKALWEVVRRHDTTTDKRAKLISAIMSKVEGRMAELAGSHAASRVIQTCVKFGTSAERARILQELEPKLLELSKSPYGHFVVGKLISLASKEQLPGVLKVFRGHLGELLRHPAGCHVVNELYAVADAKQRNVMASEFYGKEYVLFEGGTLNHTEGAPARLGDLMAHVDGAKQRSIIQHMSKDLIPMMEKGLVDCPLVHRLLSEYIEFSPASLVADAAETLSGDPLLHMVHTKLGDFIVHNFKLQEGVKVACMVLAYGTAKDRKKALKCMKGHVRAMACDEWGHLALITALSVVDDTLLLRKAIVSELQDNLFEMVDHKYAYRVLIQLLHPNCGRYLPAQLLAIACPPAKQYAVDAMQGRLAAADHPEDKQEDISDVQSASGPLGISRKGRDVRRRELLSGGNSSLASALVRLCDEKAGQLIRSRHGSHVLIEVCCGGEGGMLQECLEDPGVFDQVHDSLVAAVADSSSDEEPALSHYYGSRALRRLLLASHAMDASGALAAAFSSKLWHRAIAGRCKLWAHTHAAKVLAALLRCNDEHVRSAAATELKPLVEGSLDDWCEQLLSSSNSSKKQSGRPNRGQQAAE